MLDRLMTRPILDGIKLLLIVFIMILAAADIALSEPLQAEANAAYMLSTQDVEKAISEALEQQDAADHVRASLIGKFGKNLYSSDTPMVIEIRDLTYDSKDMRWESTLTIFQDGELATSIPVDGRYETLIEVPVLTKRLRNGDIIEEDDIVWQLEIEHRLRKQTVMNAKDMIGKTPRRVLSEKRPIRENELVAPVVMAKGALVNIEFKTANMEIRTTGEALTDGAMGELVRIRNTDSNIVVQARITGKNSAAVEAMPQLASAQ